MLWRRFRVFASLWWRLFAWGQSRTAKMVKVLGLAFTAIGIPALLTSNLIISLLLNGTPHVYTVSVGKLIAVTLLIAWALITGALAWERSGVPMLTVDDHLVWDGIRFRLTLRCKDKPCDTSVRLLEIVDVTGRHIFDPSRLNLDLEWTHHSDKSDIHIKANESESVSVATIHDNGRSVELIFTGATYKDKLLVINKAFFHLRVANGSNPIDRWFCFTPKDRFFDVTSEAPSLPPQNLSQSPTRELTE
jgi:hypothetical protein